MENDQILLLGYPINRIPLERLETVLNELVEKYYKVHVPSFATSVNGLILGQLSGCNINNRLRPEVVETLRQADFIGLDSKELQLLSKLLGNEVPSLIRSEDLLFAAANYVSKRNQSLYLVGGDEKLCHEAAVALKEDFPDLEISGISSPSIFTKGKRLESSLERDPYIVDAINQANPTILILQLGHPKQEIWFDRIKDHLKVPLCIGVGGGFERYLQARNNFKPDHKDSLGWEKIRRRLSSALHYACWIPPLFLFNTMNRLFADFRFAFKDSVLKDRLFFLSEKESLTILPFPSSVTYKTRAQALEWIQEALEHDTILLDFTKVIHMDLSGMGLLADICKEVFKLRKNIFILGISHDLRWLLKLHGAWDIVQHFVCENPDEVLDRMSTNLGISLKCDREFMSIQQIDNQTVLSFFGRLQGINTYPYSLKQLTPIIEHRNCIVNLTYCSSINNPGFAFLLKLQEYLEKQNKSLTLIGTQRSVRKQFERVQLNNYFHFKKSLSAG